MRILCTLSTAILIALTAFASALADETVYLWMDDENTYSCFDPWTEGGCTLQFVTTLPGDCDGGGECSFGWSEGVIYMHATRLRVDFEDHASDVGAVSIEAWSMADSTITARLWLGGAMIDEAIHEAGETMVLDSGGQGADSLTVVGCEGATWYPELYEIWFEVRDDTAVDDGLAEHAGVALHPCFPNPFNPTTKLRFDMERAGPVRLAILDAGGRLLRVLVDEVRSEGTHEIRWDGRDGDGRPLPSGVYFYEVTAGVHRAARKMTLLK